ncbi:MAG: penicillin-binding protein 2 [Desulfobacterales bacterium]|nr:penicillin-binding protein 2 [Desulfobacterales bacterium]
MQKILIDNYYKTVDSEWYKQRLIRGMFIVIIAILILGIRLFYLQILEGGEFRRLSENNCIRLQEIESNRGLIFDLNKKLMVDNRPSFDLLIVPKDARPIEFTINRLSAHTALPEEELLSKVKSKKGGYSYKPILLKKDITRDLLAIIEANKFDIPGTLIDVTTKRHYIFTQSAAHLLGYLGEITINEMNSGKYPGGKLGDFVGKCGVEKTFEQYLKGKRGGMQVEVNSTGQVVKVLKTVEAKPGNNIFLNIDIELQKKAEELLSEASGAVVAMDPSTGAILIMASSPSFDQNAFITGMSPEEWQSLISNPFNPMENKVIQAEYPPASVYKIVTAMAGLEEGAIDQKTIIYCPGKYTYGDRDFKCWKKWGHGYMDVVNSLSESCDVFFYHVGQKLGVDKIAWYAKQCGLGKPTNINLDYEASGLIPTSSWKKRRFGTPWQGGETLSIAIGQGYNLVTPLQLLVLISAVANGGTIYKPLILKRIETMEGNVLIENKPEIVGKLPVKKENLDIIRKGLWEVVNGKKGTARIVKVDNIEISGKTGTAQVVSRKKNEPSDENLPDHLKSHAWFVSYAPSVNPKIAVVVFIAHGEHGSSAAGPVAREIIKEYFKFERPIGNK